MIEKKLTEKKYYDSHGEYYSVESPITEIFLDEKNSRAQISLEKTVVYPGGGGQSIDQGFLNEIPLLNVFEEGGIIWHEIPIESGKALSVGESLRVTIDENLRRRNSQIHTAQHLISAVLFELFGLETLSVSLGEPYFTIDLNTDSFEESKRLAVQARANELICENRAVEGRWVSKEELDQYRLRRELKVTGDIRLVLIEGIDVVGCGGTHVKSLGELSVVKGWYSTRQKRQIRTYWSTGEVAFEQFESDFQRLRELSTILSTPKDELCQTVRKKVKEISSLEFHRGELYEKIVEFQIEKSLQNIKEETPWYIAQEGTKEYIKRVTKKLPLLQEREESLPPLLWLCHEEREEGHNDQHEAVKFHWVLLSQDTAFLPPFLELIKSSGGRGGGGKGLLQGKIQFQETKSFEMWLGAYKSLWLKRDPKKDPKRDPPSPAG